MDHPIHRVSRFDIVGPYTVSIWFDDDTQQVIDFRPVLHGAPLEPLQDPEEFNAVRLDEESGTLVWPSGADFDPATLHDWPDVREELIERAKTWKAASERRADPRMQPTHR